MTDILIRNAPSELQDIIWQRKVETYEEHRLRQPYAFPVTGPAGLKPPFDAKFKDPDGKPLTEAPRIFCAYRDGAFCGYIELGPVYAQIRQPEPVVMIEDLWVDPWFRGLGIGKALLDHVKALRVQEGWDVLVATVWTKNEASQRLFQSSGFSPQSTDFRFGTDGQRRDWEAIPRKRPWHRREDVRYAALILAMIMVAVIVAVLN